MVKTIRASLILLIVATVLLCGCASTQLTHTWADKERQGKHVSSVLVIVVAKDEAVRRSFEDKFVEQLKAKGMNAVSSANVIPLTGNQKLEKNQILEAVEKNKNDAVIVTQLKNIDKQQTYVPARRTYDGYYGYYGYAYGNVLEPAYYRTDTYVLLETNLYDVKSEKLIWSGASKTWNPGSTNSLIDGVISAVIEDLRKNQFLKP